MTSRRDFLTSSALVLGAPMLNRGRFALFPWSRTEYSERCVALVKQSLVIDMLSPITLNFPKMNQWFANPKSFTAADFARYRDSGINVFHTAVGIGGPEANRQTFEFIAAWNGFIAGNERFFIRVDSVDDFDRLKGSGKVGIVLGVQNSEHFRTPQDVDVFHSVGQRVSQLTYNARNLIGNGSTERRDEGL